MAIMSLNRIRQGKRLPGSLSSTSHEYVDARNQGPYCASRNGSFVLYRNLSAEAERPPYLRSSWASCADRQSSLRTRRRDDSLESSILQDPPNVMTV